MSEREYVLSARNLRVQFGGVTALDLDRLDIPAAGSVAAVLMGTNGAGKTTFIDAVSGFVAPRNGASIRLRAPDEVELVRASRATRVHAGIARTFQRPPVFVSLTVMETISVARAGARLKTAGSRAESEMIENVAEGLGIADLLSRRTASLPLHLLRRVEFARLLATQPRLLLLDEPTAGSDDTERERLAALLITTVPQLVARLHATNAYRFPRLTTCVVTHDLKFARQLSDANTTLPVHVFAGGHIRASGELQALFSDRELRSSYFGEPSLPC